MKSLGIFGDSFADDTYGEQGKSWIDTIRDANEYKITNYSKAGSNMWYTYSQFIENHNKNEQNIVLITNPNRIIIPKDSPLKVSSYMSYLQVLEQFDNHGNSVTQDYILLRDYYEKIHNSDQDESLHALMVKEIESLSPNTILYYSIPPTEHIFSLFHITMFECRCLGIDITTKDRWTYASNMVKKIHSKGARDQRKCHMTDDNNQVVGKMFLNRLRGKDVNLSFSDLIKPNKPLEYYFHV